MTVAGGGTGVAATSRVRLLHLSDIHCGRPYVAAQMEAAIALAAELAVSAIVVAGDLTQRARVTEFVQAAQLLRACAEVAPTVVVPGNHDTAWWHAPFGWGDAAKLHARYRTWITPELEPTLRLPGLSLIGLNSAAGMLPQALTWYPRDWRVKGGLTAAQLATARERVAASPAGDLRVVVVHHNVLRGRLSRRWGLARPEATLDALVATGAEVVCSGHDHEERLEVVERATGRLLVSTANTLSNRMRGHRPSAVTVIEADATTIAATAWHFDRGVFVPGSIAATMRR